MYYVYHILDPKTRQPFYVGKGKKERMFDHLRESQDRTDNPRKFAKINKIRSLGQEPIVEAIQFFDDEALAYEFEAKLIASLGRKGFEKDGILTNICIDSRPPSWGSLSIDSQNAIKNAVSVANKGREHTPESKTKISLASKGKPKPPRSEEHCMALSKALRGKPHAPCSEITREKRRVNAKNQARNAQADGTSEATRIAISKALTGRTLSEEHRRKISESRKKPR